MLDLYPWHLEHLNIGATRSISLGSGVTVGHPDTGYLLHSAIRDHLVVEDRHRDRLRSFAGHGTRTAHAIIEVAPSVKVQPFRVAGGPALTQSHSRKRLADAISTLAEGGCEIISISMGSPADHQGAIENAVQYAVDKGTIVIAAAGQLSTSKSGRRLRRLTSAPLPSRLPDVIACAGHDRRNVLVPWQIIRGATFDVVGPAEEIRSPFFEDELLLVGEKWKYSAGTSYATALTAGVCALWYSHNRTNGKFEQHGVNGRAYTDLFRHVLFSARFDTPRGAPHLHGSGILDAEKVLNYPIEDSLPFI